MQLSNSYEKLIPKVNDKNFKSCALDLFKYQATNNEVYKSYISHLGITPDNINQIEEIPFLPIEFFKTHEVRTGEWTPDCIYLSSGTGRAERSRHFIKDRTHYLELAQVTFERFYEPLSGTIVLALLPSYQEQGDSSLIAMVDHFINQTNDQTSGFISINNLESALSEALNKNKKVYLFGVSYALLDARLTGIQFPDRLTVIETGGMKGRKKEITRFELHKRIMNTFGIDQVNSEYGMTELLSQAYALSGGKFLTPPWMKVLIRDLNDPFTYETPGNSGGINVIDLGNVHSCAFIETKDIGKIGEDGRFEVLGRFDNSDLRGCNLLMA